MELVIGGHGNDLHRVPVLGAPLLERGRGGTNLTEVGRTFLPYAEAVLATLKDGVQAVQALQTEEHGEVSLAIVGTLAGTTIVEQLRRFSGRHGDGRLELRAGNSFEVSDMVRRGEVSLGLRYFDDPSPQLISQKVSQEVMVVACSPQHKWAGKRLLVRWPRHRLSGGGVFTGHERRRSHGVV